jgi:hypothetical protein
MAFTPTTPTDGTIPQPDAAQSLTTFHIHDLRFKLTPTDPAKTKVSIDWSEGYMDGATYVPVKYKRGGWDSAEDSDLLDAINAVTTGGTMYNELKTSLWDFLQTKNAIGDGSIT